MNETGKWFSDIPSLNLPIWSYWKFKPVLDRHVSTRNRVVLPNNAEHHGGEVGPS